MLKSIGVNGYKFGWIVEIEAGKKESDIFGWNKFAGVLNFQTGRDRPFIFAATAPRKMTGKTLTLKIRFSDIYKGEEDDWRDPLPTPFTMGSATNADPNALTLIAAVYFNPFYDFRWFSDTAEVETVQIRMVGN